MKGRPLILIWEFVKERDETLHTMKVYLDSAEEIYVNNKGLTEKGKEKFKSERNITVSINESYFKIIIPSLDYEDEHVYTLVIIYEKGKGINAIVDKEWGNIHVKDIKGKH